MTKPLTRKQVVARLKKLQVAIATERDQLVDLKDEIEALDDSCQRADDSLQEAIDALSETV